MLVFVAWVGQILLLHAKRHPNAIETIGGAVLDIGGVIWLYLQHRWLVAVLTVAVLPIATAAILGYWFGRINNRVKI